MKKDLFHYYGRSTCNFFPQYNCWSIYNDDRILQCI